MKDALMEFLYHLNERGALLTPEAFNYLHGKENDAKKFMNIIYSLEHIPSIIGMDDLKNIMDGGAASFIKKDEMHIHKDIEILRDVTGNLRSVAEVEGFLATFLDRYSKIYSMLSGKSALKNRRKIERAKNMNGEEISIIGMVRDTRETKKGYMITVEDPTGVIDVFFSKEKMREKPLLDEVIGIYGKVSYKRSGRNTIIFGDRIVWPDIQPHTLNTIKERIGVAFISDIHVGNKTFLKDAWDKFTRWLHDPEARYIEYLIISGDVVDGIGIYPDQEDELEIADIYGQYRALSEMLKDIPDRIKIIMLPGNHDFVRPAEPQPAFDNKIKSLFSGDITFTGSPVMLDIAGIKILAYHGTSINDFISVLPGVSYEDPSLALIRMLKSRILAPIYGGKTPLAPEKEDYMVIDEVPDIFVTGHVHSFIKSNYKGTIVINASTWQSQTKYQKLNNFKPVPGVVAVVDLSTGRVEEKRFYT